MAFKNWPDSLAYRHYMSLSLFAIRTPFAINDQPMVLPIIIILIQTGKFRNQQASIRQSSDHQPFFMGLAGTSQAVGLALG